MDMVRYVIDQWFQIIITICCKNLNVAKYDEDSGLKLHVAKGSLMRPYLRKGEVPGYA